MKKIYFYILMFCGFNFLAFSFNDLDISPDLVKVIETWKARRDSEKKERLTYQLLKKKDYEIYEKTSSQKRKSRKNTREKIKKSSSKKMKLWSFVATARNVSQNDPDDYNIGPEIALGVGRKLGKNTKVFLEFKMASFDLPDKGEFAGYSFGIQQNLFDVKLSKLTFSPFVSVLYTFWDYDLNKSFGIKTIKNPDLEGDFSWRVGTKIDGVYKGFFLEFYVEDKSNPVSFEYENGAIVELSPQKLFYGFGIGKPF